MLTAGLALVLAFSAIGNCLLHADGHAVVRVRWAKEARDPQHDYERWNAFSRVTVDGDPSDPGTDQLSLVIDSTAGTELLRSSGHPDASSENDFLRGRIENLVHNIRQPADVAVIGVGGGRDVLSALEFGQRSVTGIEINGDILDIVNGKFGDFTGHLDRDPRVAIVNDEARAYLDAHGPHVRHHPDRPDRHVGRDVVGRLRAERERPLHDAGVEHVLRPTQAGGVLSVSRFYQTTDAHGKTVPPLETYRTVALAAKVLTERGVDNPRDHILVYQRADGFRSRPGDDAGQRAAVHAGRHARRSTARAAQFDFTPVLTADVSERSDASPG